MVKCFHAQSCEWNFPHVLSDEEYEALDVEAGEEPPPMPKPIPLELIPENTASDIYYRYLDDQMRPSMIIHRRNHPDGSKAIFPMYFSGERLEYGMPVGLYLYGRQLLDKHPDGPVLVVEGEKATHKAYTALVRAGRSMPVVTWPLGSSNVLKGDWRALKGRPVILWPDNDEAGIKAMKVIEEILKS